MLMTYLKCRYVSTFHFHNFSCRSVHCSSKLIQDERRGSEKYSAKTLKLQHILTLNYLPLQQQAHTLWFLAWKIQFRTCFRYILSWWNIAKYCLNKKNLLKDMVCVPIYSKVMVTLVLKAGWTLGSPAISIYLCNSTTELLTTQCCLGENV